MRPLEPTVMDADVADGPLFENDFVHVVTSATGDRAAVTVGTGNGAVALVLASGRILMIRTPRYAIGSLEWELPRGGALEDEPLLETAARCVEGWSGVTVDIASAVPLGTMNPDAEILTNEVALFVLDAVTSKIRFNHENTQWVDEEKLIDACLSGEIEDSFTCMAVLRARLNGVI